MRQLITKPFPYFVGIYSLEELVTKDSRVCVINILGNESRKVTPVSHEYSGGNIVAGVQYGRRGVLETRLGEIPVYPSVRDVMEHGHEFDMGVIYLPPTAVSQAAWELVRYNKNLKRIVIITEKVPTRDSRNIRFICQEAGVDVIGANCLGVANAWDHVRVGGALGGDHPEETIRKGSVAIHSNSGNFTTTIAEYLRTSGFGISTAVSSGKDVYIHFALAEFLYAAQNDPRTKAVALYVEPGGYYEKQALDWIKERKFGFNKPIVVCVTGRWKKDLNRSCGHAGAMAGSGDGAEEKEQWFDDYFETGAFDPDNPVVTKKGVRVASIHHFPSAMQAIYKKIDESPDFKSSGDLSLKLWISDNILSLPKSLDLPVTEAIHPYNEQIKEINKLIGANYMRQNMRNKSGASRMNPHTHVAELHGSSVLELSKATVEENLYFALARVMPGKQDIAKINVLLNLFLKWEDADETGLARAKANQCTPNASIASQIAALGDHPLIRQSREYSKVIIDGLREYGIYDSSTPIPKSLESYMIKQICSESPEPPDALSEILLNELAKSSRPRVPFHLCRHILSLEAVKKKGVRNLNAFLIAAIGVDIFWNPMLAKHITRQTVEDAIAHIFIFSRIAVSAVLNPGKNSYWQKLKNNDLHGLTGSFTSNLFKMLFNRKPTDVEIEELKYLLGLTITNGPGTISAKGAKESVSARNHIPTAYVGFLCNTGFAHGGNGFEAVAFLMENFKDSRLSDPGTPNAAIDLESLAKQAAKTYGTYKQNAKETGELNYKRIPCINHPVFKGNDINIDPREDFVRKEMESKNIYNVFLDFYHHLVKELFNEGVTQNVFCVNVDAVLAVITLKLIWKDLQNNAISFKDAQDLVFILFLLGRAIGVAAEIDDHKSRGQDMDCRTPQSEIEYVL